MVASDQAVGLPGSYMSPPTPPSRAGEVFRTLLAQGMAEASKDCSKEEEHTPLLEVAPLILTLGGNVRLSLGVVFEGGCLRAGDGFAATLPGCPAIHLRVSCSRYRPGERLQQGGDT